MTFTISIGKYGGFYFRKGYSIRLCLGWIAFTWLPVEIDDILEELISLRDKTKSNYNNIAITNNSCEHVKECSRIGGYYRNDPDQTIARCKCIRTHN